MLEHVTRRMADPVALKVMESHVLDRLVRNEKTGCWEWQGGRTEHGYGMTRAAGSRRDRMVSAHRLFYMLYCGSIPSGLCVLHSCDNPPCCNPTHLWLGTNADNMADMKRKGRGRSVAGERSRFAKLTDGDVMLIRQRYQAGESCPVIASDYQITPTAVSFIATGKAWRHLPGTCKPRSAKWNRLTPPKIAEAARLRTSGLLLREIAELFGVSQSTVCVAIQKYRAENNS